MSVAEISFEKRRVEYIFADPNLMMLFEVKCLKGNIQWWCHLYCNGRSMNNLGPHDHPENSLAEAQELIAAYRKEYGIV